MDERPRPSRRWPRVPQAPEPPAPPTEETPAPPPPPTGLRNRLYHVPVIGAIVYLIAPPRTRRSVVRRVVSSASGIVAIIGLGMVAYPWAGAHYPGFIRWPVERGIEWSNVISDLQTNKLQAKLKTQFDATTLASAPKEGDPLTRIQIPSLGVDTIVVEGTSTSALKAGAGHYPGTPLPGQKGNVSIAGHRTTYGRPFNAVDRLVPGDKILLTTPVGVFTYEVSVKPWITTATDWSIVGKSADPLLTLTSCHPKGSDRQRIVVRAKLIKSERAGQTGKAA